MSNKPISLTDKRCLVTGASGFVGAYICKELRRLGAVVIEHVRSRESAINQLSLVCDFDEDDIPNNLLCNIDIVFHLAGRAHSLADSNSENTLYYKTNVEGTRKLLIAAKNAKISKFIFFSSVKAMTEENNDRLAEAYEPQPITIYGKSKLEAERLVLEGGYVPSPTVLRLTMVYGCTNKGNLPKMIKAFSSNWFPPFPRIENKRSMIHVEDVVQCAMLAAACDTSSGEIYIVSDGIDYSTRRLYEVIRGSLGKPVPLWGVPVSILITIAKIGDVLNMFARRRVLFDSDNLQKLIGNSYFSSNKIKMDLGFSPKYNLFKAIPDIIASLKTK